MKWMLTILISSFFSSTYAQCWRECSGRFGLRDDGTLWTLSYEGYFQQLTESQFEAEDDWQSISQSASILALKTNGSLWAWGNNYFGQTGNGQSGIEQYIDDPIMVGTETDWVYVCSSDVSSFALKADHSLWAWGSNSHGQLGNGNNIDLLVPTKIGGASWLTVSSRGRSTYAIRNDGTLWAWGLNDIGQLGTGDSINRLTPVQIGEDSDWTMVKCGYDHVIALKSNGTVWTWGSNNCGQLGDGTNLPKMSPEQVPIGEGWVDIAAMGTSFAVIGGQIYVSTSMAVKNDNTLWAWGHLGSGHPATWGTYLFTSTAVQLAADIDNIQNITDNTGYLITDSNEMFLVSKLSDWTSAMPISCVQLSLNSSALDEIQIYPNPVRNHINISIPNTFSNPPTYHLYNILGEVFKINGNRELIDVSGVPQGLYILEIAFDNSHKIYKKINKT